MILQTEDVAERKRGKVQLAAVSWLRGLLLGSAAIPRDFGWGLRDWALLPTHACSRIRGDMVRLWLLWEEFAVTVQFFFRFSYCG